MKKKIAPLLLSAVMSSNYITPVLADTIQSKNNNIKNIALRDMITQSPRASAQTTTITINPYKTDDITTDIIQVEFDNTNTFGVTKQGVVNDEPFDTDDIKLNITQVTTASTEVGEPQQATSFVGTFSGTNSQHYALGDVYKPTVQITPRKTKLTPVSNDISFSSEAVNKVKLVDDDSSDISALNSFMPNTLTANNSTVGDVTLTKDPSSSTYSFTLTEEQWKSIVQADVTELNFTITGSNGRSFTQDDKSGAGTALNNNFALATGMETFTLNITPVNITPTVTTQDKVYDGTTNATTTLQSVTGTTLDIDYLQDNDLIKLGISNFDSKDVGVGKNVTTSIAYNKQKYIRSSQGTGSETVTSTASITKSASDISTPTQNIEAPDSVEYGSPLEITVKPEILARNNVTPYTLDRIELYKGDELLAEGSGSVIRTTEGTYTLSYDTSDRKLDIGQNTLKVKFTGSQNLEASETTIQVELKPKTIQTTYNHTYQYDNKSSIDVELTISSSELIPNDRGTFLKKGREVTGSATLQLDPSTLEPGTPTVLHTIPTLSDEYYTTDESSTTGTVTITKRDITPVFTFKDKDYDGTDEATLVKGTFDNMIAKDTNLPEQDTNWRFTVQPTFDNENAGEDKTVTATIELIPSGDLDRVYNLTTTRITGTASIAKSTPDFEIDIPSEFTYDEEITATVKPIISRNFFSVGQDTVVIETQDGVELGRSSSASRDGTYTITFKADNKIPLGSNNLVIKYGGSSNFLMKEASHSINMKHKEIDYTPSALTPTREYDGTTNFKINLATTDNAVGDDITLTYNTNNIVQVASPDVADNLSASLNNSNIEISGDNAQYYKVRDLGGSKQINNLEIIPDTFTLTNFTPIVKVYDGTTEAVVDTYTVQDKNSPGQEVTIKTTATYDTKDVGDNKTVTINAVIEPPNPNYLLAQNTFTTSNGQITKADSDISKPNDNIIAPTQVEFGENLDITVKPSIVKFTRSVDKIELYKEGELIAQGDRATDTLKVTTDGTYTLSYNTGDRKLDIGDNQLTVKFTGNNNLNESETIINVELLPKTVNLSYNETYQYDNENIKTFTTTVPDSELVASEQGQSKIVNSTITVNLNPSSLEPGTPTINSEDIILNDNYYIATDLSTTGSITITKRDITTDFTFEDKVYDGTDKATVLVDNFGNLVSKDRELPERDVTWEFVDEPVFDNPNVGRRTVTGSVRLIGKMNDLYNLADGTIHGEANITKSTPDLVISFPSQITYDEDIVVTVKPTVKKSFFSIGDNTVVLETEDGQEIARNSTPGPDGTFTFNIKVDEKLKLGVNNITAKYGGSSNFLMKSQPVQTTLSPKEIDYEVGSVISPREYDGTNRFKAVLNPLGHNTKDAISLKYGDDNYIEADGVNVGNNYSSTLNNNLVHIEGQNSQYYTIKDKQSTKPYTGLEIIPDEIDLESFSPAIKKYDGNTKANVSSFEVTNKNTDEELEISITAEYDNPNVGTNKQVIITPVFDVPQTNYAFSSPTFTATNGEITKIDTSIDNPDGSGNNESVTIPKEVTFGDSIEITVSPKMSKANLQAGTPNTVELYNEADELIAIGNQTGFDGLGTWTITYDTSDRKLKIGNNRVKVVFVGNDNMNHSEYYTTIIMKQRELTGEYNLSYEYDGLTDKTATLQLQNTVANDVTEIPIYLTLSEMQLNVGDTPTVTDMKYNISDPYYKLPKDNITGNITITQATISSRTTEVTLPTNSSDEFNLNLDKFLPNIPVNQTFGSTTYGSAQNSNITGIFQVDPNIIGNTLNYTLNEMPDENPSAGSTTIEVVTQNFLPFNIVLNYTVKDRLKPVVEVKTKPIIYGPTIGETQYEYTATYNDSEVSGTLQIVTDNGNVPDVGTHTLDVTFTPDDTVTYEDVQTTCELQVIPRTAISVTEPKVSEFEWVKGKPLSEYLFETKGEFTGYNDSTINTDDYELEWELPSKEVMPNIAYAYTMVHDNGNYIYRSLLVPMNIGGGILIPGENGEIIIPSPDGDSSKDIIITPTNPDEDLIFNGDGSITIPGESEMDFPKWENGGTDITLPPGTTVNGDGSITLPPPSEVNPMPDWNLKPENGHFKPDHNGSIVLPDGGELNIPKDNEPPYILPPGSIIKPTFPEPNGGCEVTLPNEDSSVDKGDISYKPTNKPPTVIINPDGSVTLPDGGTVERPAIDPDGPNDGNEIIINPNQPNTTIPNPDGSITLPDGGDVTIKNPDTGEEITVETPPGTIVYPDGSIKLPGDDDIATVPDKPNKGESVEINPDNPDNIFKPIPPGWIEFPNGGTVTKQPDNISVEVKPGDKVDITDDNTFKPPIEKPTDNGNNGGNNSGGSAIIGKPVNPVEPKPEHPDSSEPSNDGGSYYPDTDGNWAEDIIDRLTELGIINGYDDGLFRPNDNIKRGDLAITVYNLLSKIYKIHFNEPYTSTYTDVTEDRYYYEAVEKLSQYKILEGYNDGTFKPDQYITREEMSVIVAKLSDLLQLNISQEEIIFEDADNISSWADVYVKKATQLGVIKGYPDGTFKPKGNITRAEVVSILYNFLPEDLQTID